MLPRGPIGDVNSTCRNMTWTNYWTEKFIADADSDLAVYREGLARIRFGAFGKMGRAAKSGGALDLKNQRAFIALGVRHQYTL